MNVDDPFTVEYVVTREPVCDTCMSSTDHGRTSSPATPATVEDQTPVAIEHVTPPTHDSRIDADADDDAPQHYHTVVNILGPKTPRGYVLHQLDLDELHMVSAEEPSSFAEAEQSYS